MTWEGFQTRASTCSPEKDLAPSMGLSIDDFNQREHVANLFLEFLSKHHQGCRTHSRKGTAMSLSERQVDDVEAQFHAAVCGVA